MIIDIILDRKEGLPYTMDEMQTLYEHAMNFNFWHLADCLDNGDNKQIQKALCQYIDDNSYDSKLKKYINSVNWVADE